LNKSENHRPFDKETAFLAVYVAVVFADAIAGSSIPFE